MLGSFESVNFIVSWQVEKGVVMREVMPEVIFYWDVI